MKKRLLRFALLSFILIIFIILTGAATRHVYASSDAERDDTFLTAYANADGTFDVYAYTAINHGFTDIDDNNKYYPPTVEVSKTGDYHIDIAPEFSIESVAKELPSQSAYASVSYSGNTVSWRPDFTIEPTTVDLGFPFQITPINVIKITIKPRVTGTGHLTVATLFNMKFTTSVWNAITKTQTDTSGTDDVDQNIELTSVALSDTTAPVISSHFYETSDLGTPITTTSSKSVYFVSKISNVTGVPKWYTATQDMTDVMINGTAVGNLSAGTTLDLSAYSTPSIKVKGKVQIAAGTTSLSSTGTYSYSTRKWNVLSHTKLNNVTVDMDVNKPQVIERGSILDPQAVPNQQAPYVYSATNESKLQDAVPISDVAKLTVTAAVTPTTPTVPATKHHDTTSKISKTPDTGDASPLIDYLMIMVIASSILILIAANAKKRSNGKERR